jgi:protease I
MANELQGQRIAILATDGVERVELAEPRQALEDAGAITRLLSIHDGEIQARDHDHDLDPAGTFAVEGRFVRDFVSAGKPVAAICHGLWTLVEADVVRGRTLTSWPSIRTDLRNAGANVVDQEAVVDGRLVTSRSPDDLPAFCATIIHEFQTAAASA